MNPDITLPKPKFKKTYTALITQTGTDAPTAQILQNTLGFNITWTRFAQGEFRGTPTGGNTLEVAKTTIQLGSPTLYNGTNYYTVGTNYVTIFGYNGSSAIDTTLSNTLVEISVYDV